MEFCPDSTRFVLVAVAARRCPRWGSSPSSATSQGLDCCHGNQFNCTLSLTVGREWVGDGGRGTGDVWVRSGGRCAGRGHQMEGPSVRLSTRMFVCLGFFSCHHLPLELNRATYLNTLLTAAGHAPLWIICWYNDAQHSTNLIWC